MQPTSKAGANALGAIEMVTLRTPCSYNEICAFDHSSEPFIIVRTYGITCSQKGGGIG